MALFSQKSTEKVTGSIMKENMIKCKCFRGKRFAQTSIAKHKRVFAWINCELCNNTGWIAKKKQRLRRRG